MSKQCPALTHNELDLAFREGATDAEIEAKICDLFFWSYIVRNPLGRVCGRSRPAAKMQWSCLMRQAQCPATRPSASRTPDPGSTKHDGDDDDTLFRLIALGTGKLSSGDAFGKLDYRRKGSEAEVGPMPPFGEIIKTDDDLWKIIAWIRSVYCGRRAEGC